MGDTVKVFYDPTNPARAILRPISDSLSVYGITLFGIAWHPYHVVDDGGRALELPAFEEKAPQ